MRATEPTLYTFLHGLQAEHFDYGWEGVGYSDTEGVNLGGVSASLVSLGQRLYSIAVTDGCVEGYDRLKHCRHIEIGTEVGVAKCHGKEDARLRKAESFGLQSTNASHLM